MKWAIELNNLTCGYGGGPVFEGLSLKIERGSFVGIVGPTGSGTSTLLKTIIGTVKPISGEVRLFGKAGLDLPSGSLSYVPQLERGERDFPVTVEQVVAMGLYPKTGFLPWPSGEERRRVRETMERLGVAAYRGHTLANLSGGEQQRVFLARALVGRPKLLLLDEPTTGIDLKSRYDLLALLAELNREGVTVVVTTHDLNGVAAHLPWIVCVNNGLVCEGSPEEVLTWETLLKTYGAEVEVFRHNGAVQVSYRGPL